MAKLEWDIAGNRYYESGVDRGVLFIDNNPGVAWSGLISVSESPSGGEPRPYYLDGIKYLNISSAEEFEATINAFSAPGEFAPCDGRISLANGLFATQQPRKAFNLTYRTGIGNDAVAMEAGYKIHIVYNALAAPTDREYTTIGDDAEPTQMSWAITTLPPKMTGLKPTAHFVVDSRVASVGFLTALENLLYGTTVDIPQLPTPQELITLSSTP